MVKKRGKVNSKVNKRGAEMTIGTIIVIILALVVLVVIIYGFVTGWGSLWQKIIGIGGVGKPNVQTQVDSCKIACASEAKSDYCKNRNVIFDDNSNRTLNCESLVSSYGTTVGLDACSTINCGAAVAQTKPCENSGIWVGHWTDGTSICNKDTQIDFTSNSLLLASDKQPNKKCCVDLMGSCPGTWITPDKNCDPGYNDITALILPTAKITGGNQANKCCVQF